MARGHHGPIAQDALLDPSTAHINPGHQSKQILIAPEQSGALAAFSDFFGLSEEPVPFLKFAPLSTSAPLSEDIAATFLY